MKPLSPTAALLALALSSAAGAQTSSSGPALRTPGSLDVKALVLVESGDLPIVLSAPHGGEVEMTGIPERRFGTHDLDENTLQLALAIQKELSAITGGRKAHLVAGLISRHYVDFNRAAGQAYEVEAVAPVYDRYHEALRSAIQAAKDKAGTKALLIDIHGQSDNVAKVYRGTQDGQTADLPLLCQDAPAGLIATMMQQGLPVHPDSIAGTEPADYNGG